MTLAALFAGLMTVCAWISLPVLDISYTMQTFGILLTLGVLGGKWGSISIGIYLMMGAVGLPVFSGFQGGLGVLLGVTGGYIWGFLLGGLAYWALEKLPNIIPMTAAILMCYLCGSCWFLLWSGTASIPFVLIRCVLPYVIPDGIKLYLALRLNKRLKRVLFR